MTLKKVITVGIALRGLAGPTGETIKTYYDGWEIDGELKLDEDDALYLIANEEVMRP